MPGYVERNGILHFKQMANMLIYDLQRFGFVIAPNSMDTKAFVNILKGEDVNETTGINGKTELVAKYTLCATMTAGPTVDPLSSTQPWRIRIDASGVALTPPVNNAKTTCVVTEKDPGFMRVFVAHPLQLSDDGKVATEFSGLTTDAVYSRYAGELTCGYINSDGWGGGIGNADRTVTLPFASAKFTYEKDDYRDKWAYGSIVAHPLSYMLSVSDRGVAFVCWQEAQDDYGDRFSWFVVQRPVDPITGATLADETKSKCPVFCIYSIGGGTPHDVTSLQKNYDVSGTTGGGDVYANLVTILNTETAVQESPYDIPNIYRFTVRESDIFRPTTPVLATADSPDNRSVMNGKQQVAIAEDGRYVIFYPNGFNTDRYMYREEVDTLVYTSADVISQWQEVNLEPYPGKPRVYKACLANITNNRGMRILLMVEQPGVLERLADCIDPPIVDVLPDLPYVTGIAISTGVTQTASNTRLSCQAQLTLSNNSYMDGSNSVIWSSTPSYTFDGSTFVAPVVKTDTPVTIKAVYNNTTAHPDIEQTAVVTVKAATVRSVSIIGPTTIVSGAKSTYGATLTLADLSTTPDGATLVAWTVESGGGSFSGNMFTAPVVTTNTTVTIKAVYDNTTGTDPSTTFQILVTPPAI